MQEQGAWQRIQMLMEVACHNACSSGLHEHQPHQGAQRLVTVNPCLPYILKFLGVEEAMKLHSKTSPSQPLHWGFHRSKANTSSDWRDF